jgi:hypothetical protein
LASHRAHSEAELRGVGYAAHTSPLGGTAGWFGVLVVSRVDRRWTNQDGVVGAAAAPGRLLFFGTLAAAQIGRPSRERASSSFGLSASCSESLKPADARSCYLAASIALIKSWVLRSRLRLAVRPRRPPASPVRSTHPRLSRADRPSLQGDPGLPRRPAACAATPTAPWLSYAIPSRAHLRGPVSFVAGWYYR